MRITKNYRLLNHQAVQSIDMITPLALTQNKEARLDLSTKIARWYIFFVLCHLYEIYLHPKNNNNFLDSNQDSNISYIFITTSL